MLLLPSHGIAFHSQACAFFVFFLKLKHAHFIIHIHKNENKFPGEITVRACVGAPHQLNTSPVHTCPYHRPLRVVHVVNCSTVNRSAGEPRARRISSCSGFSKWKGTKYVLKKKGQNRRGTKKEKGRGRKATPWEPSSALASLVWEKVRACEEEEVVGVAVSVLLTPPAHFLQVKYFSPFSSFALVCSISWS